MNEWIFYISMLGCVYSYFIYPLVLLLLKKRNQRAKPAGESTENPAVTIIITAFNEAGRIKEKLENTLAIDYPKDRLDVIVASDASTDDTDMIVQSFAEQGVRLVRAESRKGKEYAQSLAIKEARGEILVFSDAGTTISVDSINILVERFAESHIGAISSVDKFISQDGAVVGEGLYVKYEMWLRQLECRVNSLIGLSGSYFAARRNICERWDIASPSDFNVAINCARLGYIAVSDPNVIGYYKDVKDSSKEYQRKYRTIIRGITALFRSLEVLNPFKYGFFSFQIFSHKVMRWLVPWFMCSLLLSSIVLASVHWLYLLVLLGQLLFYSLASLGWLVSKSRLNTFVKLAFFFMQVNIAIAHASLAYALGKRMTVWQPSKR